MQIQVGAKVAIFFFSICSTAFASGNELKRPCEENSSVATVLRSCSEMWDGASGVRNALQGRFKRDIEAFITASSSIRLRKQRWIQIEIQFQ